MGSQLLKTVAEVAALAGAEALKHFGGALEVHAKSDGSPVTRADRDCVADHFPSSGAAGR